LTQNATLAIRNLHEKELPDASELEKKGKNFRTVWWCAKLAKEYLRDVNPNACEV
jgi:hypothetical protein